MKMCCVHGCCNRDTKRDAETVRRNITFHRFPCSRKELFETWITAVNRGPEWRPSRYTIICSEHFLESDFLSGYHARRRLTDDAVPSLFHSRNQLEMVKRRKIKRPSLGVDNVLSEVDSSSAPTDKLHRKHSEAQVHTFSPADNLQIVPNPESRAQSSDITTIVKAEQKEECGTSLVVDGPSSVSTVAGVVARQKISSSEDVNSWIVEVCDSKSEKLMESSDRKNISRPVHNVDLIHIKRDHSYPIRDFQKTSSVMSSASEIKSKRAKILGKRKGYSNDSKPELNRQQQTIMHSSIPSSMFNMMSVTTSMQGNEGMPQLQQMTAVAQEQQQLQEQQQQNLSIFLQLTPVFIMLAAPASSEGIRSAYSESKPMSIKPVKRKATKSMTDAKVDLVTKAKNKQPVKVHIKSSYSMSKLNDSTNGENVKSEHKRSKRIKKTF